MILEQSPQSGIASGEAAAACQRPGVGVAVRPTGAAPCEVHPPL